MARLNSVSAAVRRFSRSLTAQLLLLALAALAVPVLLYAAFRTADREKDALLLDAVRGQDVVIAKSLAPLLTGLAPAGFGQLPGELARFANPGTSLKLLYKPQNAAGDQAGFFYVASAPSVAADDLAAERQSLVSLGVLDRLAASCAGGQPLSQRVTLPGARHEILTSVTSLKTESGCWVLVVAAESQALLGAIGDEPYWRRPEVRAAVVAYCAMAVMVLIVFAGVGRALVRFRRVARDIDAGGSFANETHIPELASVAADFDQMVARLNETAALIRRSAEDNAHAFKTPIGIIRQSLDTMRRPVGPERTMAAQDAIAAAAAKLDGLVRSARRLDVATADLLETARHPVDLSALVEGFAAEYRLMLGEGAGQLVTEILPGVEVLGREEAYETILENLVDNAISFSPTDGRVFVILATDGVWATLSVADEGPGVAPDRLESIFERYHSDRGAEGEAPEAEAHFGVGLWLVRQNAMAMGGRVSAANRLDAGLIVTVVLPLRQA